jgi:hypothetical protein
MRFFPNVFIILERGFRVADTLVVGSYSRYLVN